MEDSNILNLKKYLIKIIDDFRKEYETLDDLERKQIAPNTIYSDPCQIEIFWVTKPSEFQLFVLIHNPHRPDKDIKINGPYDSNQISQKVLEIMDEPRWREKAPFTGNLWPHSSDIGDTEHKYSDEFAGYFSHFLNLIRQTSSQSFPQGLVMSQIMGENDYCSIFRGNIADLDPSELDQKSSIESAKQFAATIKGEIPPVDVQRKNLEDERKTRKFFGSYFSPGVRIGKNVELTFKEKVFGPDIFEYPKYEYEFSFNGRMGFYDRYGLVLIESENEADAIKIINTIFGISLIHGIEAFSVRNSDLLDTEIPLDYPPLGKPLGSYRRKISEITGTAPNFFAGMKKTQISLEKIQEIINDSEIVFLNEKLTESLLFLLEGNTHLKNGEFPQSFIFCWLIVEQFISRKFDLLLSEKKEIEEKIGKNKDPQKLANRRKMDLLHSEEKMDVSDYSFLTEFNQKRNDLVHSGKTITEPDAKKLYEFAFKIIQNEINLRKNNG